MFEHRVAFDPAEKVIPERKMFGGANDIDAKEREEIDVDKTGDTNSAPSNVQVPPSQAVVPRPGPSVYPIRCLTS